MCSGPFDIFQDDPIVGPDSWGIVRVLNTQCSIALPVPACCPTYDFRYLSIPSEVSSSPCTGLVSTSFYVNALSIKPSLLIPLPFGRLLLRPGLDTDPFTPCPHDFSRRLPLGYLGPLSFGSPFFLNYIVVSRVKWKDDSTPS